MIKIRFINIHEDVYDFIMDAIAFQLTDQEIADNVDNEVTITDVYNMWYTLTIPFKVIKNIEEANDVLCITFKSNECVELNDCEYERIEII